MMKKINDKNIEFLHRLEKKDLEIQRYDRSLGSLAATESKPLIAYITFEDRLGE